MNKEVELLIDAALNMADKLTDQANPSFVDYLYNIEGAETRLLSRVAAYRKANNETQNRAGSGAGLLQSDKPVPDSDGEIMLIPISPWAVRVQRQAV